MSISKSIVLTVVAVVALAAGTLLVAGYADRPQTPAQTACQMACEKSSAPAADGCCKTHATDDCARPKACASSAAEKSCEREPATGCPRETLAAPSAEAGHGGCGGCPGTQ